MEMTSPNPSLPSSPPSSSDGAAVGLAAELGDGAISVAASSETIACNGKDRNDGDDGDNRDNRDNREGVAVSFAAASVTTEAVTMSQWAVISSDAKSSL
jgi:hypothetical protein